MRRLPALLRSHKDVAGGALMLALGLGAAFQASRYELGTLRRMGPGYVPLGLGLILAICGALILAGGLVAPRPPAVAERAPADPRAALAVAAGLAAFALLGRVAGLVPASFAAVLIAALGRRGNSPRAALALAAVMTAIAVAVFHAMLGVQLPLFGRG